MDYGDFEIEPGIKPLVDALNEAPYIETYSSCQGHYDDGSGRDAHVLFHVSDEQAFAAFRDHLLIEMAQEEWDPVVVDFRQRFYVKPGFEEVYRNWRLHFEWTRPDELLTPELRREGIDAIVEQLRQKVQNYLKTPDESGDLFG